MGTTSKDVSSTKRSRCADDERTNAKAARSCSSSSSADSSIKKSESEQSTVASLANNDIPDAHAEPDHNPAAPSPALSGLVLNLSFRWLTAKRIAHTAAVCKQWRHQINDSEGMWKEVAENSPPAALDAIMSSAIGDTVNTKGSTMNFQRLAAGLAHDHHTNTTDFPDPQLQAKDVFLVVELLRSMESSKPDSVTKEYETLAAYCTDCNQWLIDRDCDLQVEESKPVEIDGLNPLSQEAGNITNNEELARWKRNFALSIDSARNALLSPVKYAFESLKTRASRLLRVRIRLFRRDDGRSVCLADPENVDGFVTHFAKDEEYALLYFSSSFRFSSNHSGAIARDVVKASREHNFCTLDPLCTFEPILPSPGSEEEPTWLKKLRAPAGHNNWSTTDEDEISQVNNFGFRLKKMCVRLMLVHEDGEGETYHYFNESPKELLLLLEGLDWK